MVFQDPMTSLNPYMRISDQMAEVLVHHKGMSKAQAVAEAAYRVELIVRLEGEVRANVNLKHALANLVAQWGAIA